VAVHAAAGSQARVARLPSQGLLAATEAPEAAPHPRPRLRRVRTAGMAAPSSVVVHPLVLLSVVDHYNRVAKARSEAQHAPLLQA
jgi:hypothetical protein